MIDASDAAAVTSAAAADLQGVAKNPANYRGLPDTFWGYFARGHDAKGRFATIISYSEDGEDIEVLLAMYQKWIKAKAGGAKPGPAAHPLE